MKISIGCDHAGFEAKEIIILLLKELKYDILDLGTNSIDSVDSILPDFNFDNSNIISFVNAIIPRIFLISFVVLFHFYTEVELG